LPIRRFILSPSSRIDLDPFEKHNLTPPELLKHHVKHFMQIHEPFWDTFKPSRDDIVWMTENAMLSGSLMNHYGLFLPTLLMHGNEEQNQWWADRARRMQVIL
jgi:hypothetical protein